MTPDELVCDIYFQNSLSIQALAPLPRRCITIRVISDYANLQYFFTAKSPYNRQARWAEYLAAYDFAIDYLPGRLNVADTPSRRREYKPEGLEEYRIALHFTLRWKLGGAGLYSASLEEMKETISWGFNAARRGSGWSRTPCASNAGSQGNQPGGSTMTLCLLAYLRYLRVFSEGTPLLKMCSHG